MYVFSKSRTFRKCNGSPHPLTCGHFVRALLREMAKHNSYYYCHDKIFKASHDIELCIGSIKNVCLFIQMITFHVIAFCLTHVFQYTLKLVSLTTKIHRILCHAAVVQTSCELIIQLALTKFKDRKKTSFFLSHWWVRW